MVYYHVVFSGGITGEGYQELSNNEQIRLTDLQGNTIDTDHKVFETSFVSTVPVTPEWA